MLDVKTRENVMEQPNTIEVKYGEPICCPICSQVVVDQDNAKDGEYFRVCDHTLYVAHDEGIEYTSDLFMRIAKETGVDLAEQEEVNPREIMQNSDVKGINYFETYVPAPSFYGTYVAFHKE